LGLNRGSKNTLFFDFGKIQCRFLGKVCFFSCFFGIPELKQAKKLARYPLFGRAPPPTGSISGFLAFMAINILLNKPARWGNWSVLGEFEPDWGGKCLNMAVFGVFWPN
jgi:hypothetical protein